VQIEGDVPDPVEVSAPLTRDDVRELLDSTERCLARAVKAQREATEYLDYYKAQAEQFKSRAARADTAEVRESLLRIAASHQRLLELAKDWDRLPEIPPDRDSAAKLRRRSAEEPVAQARRHVAEAQAHIARQETLVARLANEERHAAFAAEAREILATLKRTLTLAQQHLELELKK
jgi:hypothetical protein